MNQPFYIVHGFERTQSFIEDQHTVNVTILVVDIGGKDASIVRPYHNSRNLFTFLAPLVPIVEMVSGKTMVMPDDDIISLAIVTLLDEMSQQCHRWQHQSGLLPALFQALEPIHNLIDDGHVIIQRAFG